MKKNIRFLKMNGLGNKIIVADMRDNSNPIEDQEIYTLNTIIPFDQIIAIRDSKTAGTNYFLEIINSDGSLAKSCGNGIRCVTKALAEETGSSHFSFETSGGIVHAEKNAENLFCVDMGKPRFDWRDIPLSQDPKNINRFKEMEEEGINADFPHFVSIGNPHAIFFIPEDPKSYPLNSFGARFEKNSLFPEGINISFVQILTPKRIALRTWERGVGLTQACGSASCAAGVCANLSGLTEHSIVASMPGGELSVEWNKNDHVIMTGSAEKEFEAIFNPVTGIVCSQGKENQSHAP